MPRWMLLLTPFFLCFSTFVIAHDLVDIKKFNEKIEVELRYATRNNMFGVPLYPSRRIFVDRYVATRLTRVQRELAQDGMGLIVFEGYRPPSIQKRLDCLRLCHCQNTLILEDAPHYRKGLGVDVAIFYLSGQPLQLPSPWGIDQERAFRDYIYLSCHEYHNKYLLEKVMTDHGFVPMRERWWHFDLKGWEHSPDLDVEYTDLLCH